MIRDINNLNLYFRMTSWKPKSSFRKLPCIGLVFPSGATIKTRRQSYQMKAFLVSGACVWKKTEQRDSAVRQQPSLQIHFVFVFSLSP